MILSERHGLIFIKTRKTAGTSIEVFLARHLGPHDVATPLHPPEKGHVPKNHAGRFNPLPELLGALAGAPWADLRVTLHDLRHARRFWNHMPAGLLRARISGARWRGGHKFCVERNPWAKTLSHFDMLVRRGQAADLGECFARELFPTDWALYTDRADRLLVDRVLSYEDLSRELAETFQRVGIPFGGELEVRAKEGDRSGERSYRNVFDSRQRAAVARAFRKEIRAFGYDW